MFKYILHLLNFIPVCDAIRLFYQFFLNLAESTDTNVDDVAVAILHEALVYIFPDCHFED